MSRMEHRMGKLIPVVPNENETLSELKHRLLKEIGYDDKISKYKSVDECFDDYSYRKFYIYNNVIYRVEDKELPEDGDIVEATLNEDGSINYHLMWYNGGASFNEVLDEATQKLSH